MKKRGIFFSTDALIAIIIIVTIILIIVPTAKFTQRETQIHYDILNSLSNLKVSDSDNVYLQSLISTGVLNDTNKSMLEQIGEFYVTNLTIARTLADSILDEVETNKNIGLWYISDSGTETLIFSKNTTPMETAKTVETARQIISGIQQGSSVTGFSARAFLISNLQDKYFYFGGYIGDGNITAQLNYTGNISSANMEIVINNNFDLYINGIFSGNYLKSPSEFIPVSYSLNTTNFHSGKNTIEFRGNNLHIAGGFIKIIYNNGNIYEQAIKHFFPGIDGLINIYDGFYIPGNLSSLDISLHLDSPFEIFLNIGNITVFRNVTIGEQTISIPDSQLSTLLDYNDISKKTIPLRLGLENASYISGISKPVDVFSVTDLSGSMNGCAIYSEPFACNYRCVIGGSKSCTVADPSDCTGNICGGTCFIPFDHYLDCANTKLDLAKQANLAFINSILNNSDNRVGLVGYKQEANDSDYHPLSNDNNSLDAEVDSWTGESWTCICCGINKAINALALNKTPDTLQSMVVMSDGEANIECIEQSTNDSKQDAIQAACDAKEIHNITVHAVGFGSLTDELTLQAIADCGDGDYYFGDIDELIDIYKQIAQAIIEASFTEQTIGTSGNFTTRLFPDSYIKFDYAPEITPYGLLITTENQFDNNLSGTFVIPNNSTVIETTTVSYSGPKWTDNVKINNNSLYSITNYGQDYIPIGDPYNINIPNSLVQSNNTVEITVGSSPTNSTPGSSSNKIISTIAKQISAYSKIAANSEGCTWNIQFEDNTNTTFPVPDTYTGSNVCHYTQSLQQHDDNDAIQNAIFDLLKLLDLNLNNKIELKFTEQDLKIELTEIAGIPFTWSSEVQVRTWL